MGLSFRKSETLCMGRNGLSLSMLCRGSFPEEPGRLSETQEIQAVAAAQMVLSLWVKIKHREGKTSEVSGGFLKTWQSLCHGSTLTHTLMSSPWQRHSWDILPQTRVLQEDLGSPDRGCAAVEIRAPWVLLGKEPLDHAPDAARCALGDWWRLLLCPAAQVIANLQLPVPQSCACYRP